MLQFYNIQKNDPKHTPSLFGRVVVIVLLNTTRTREFYLFNTKIVIFRIVISSWIQSNFPLFQLSIYILVMPIFHFWPHNIDIQIHLSYWLSLKIQFSCSLRHRLEYTRIEWSIRHTNRLHTFSVFLLHTSVSTFTDIFIFTHIIADTIQCDHFHYVFIGTHNLQLKLITKLFQSQFYNHKHIFKYDSNVDICD